jgi:hypothetical protein
MEDKRTKDRLMLSETLTWFWALDSLFFFNLLSTSEYVFFRRCFNVLCDTYVNVCSLPLFLSQRDLCRLVTHFLLSQQRIQFILSQHQSVQLNKKVLTQFIISTYPVTLPDNLNKSSRKYKNDEKTRFCTTVTWPLEYLS